MMTSNFEVTLSVFAIPAIGIPALVASINACTSTSGSEIRINFGSM